MISDFLAEKIFKGEAQYKNHAGGIGALHTIQVPDGKICVLTDLNITFGEGSFKGEILSLCIESFKNINYFSWFANTTNQSFTRDIHQDFFIVAKNFIRLRFAVNTSILVTDFSVTDAINQEPDTPLGYGSTNIVKTANLGQGNEAYIPLGAKFVPNTLNVEKRNELYPNIGGFTTLLNPATILETFVFNLGYVLINLPASNKLG